MKMNCKFRPASRAMLEHGILAKVELYLVVGEVAVVTLEDIMIREGNDGPVVTFPSRKYTGRDGKVRFAPFYRMYPEMEGRGSDRERLKDLKDAIVGNYYAWTKPKKAPMDGGEAFDSRLAERW